MQANRQINLLLEQQVAPSDVFEQVTVGIGYASRMLEHVPDSTPIPQPDELEQGKVPSDVYQRLLLCLDHIHQIGETAGHSMLKLEADESLYAKAQPSDVYHLASLLVSELAYLHSQRRDLDDPPRVYYVGRKFPSDVYQRASILEKQLAALQQWIKDNPAWLSGGGSAP